MDIEEFQTLAAKVISRDASQEELEQLKIELYRDGSRREEFDALLMSSGLVKELQPIIDATKASNIELPSYRMGELEGAVRSAFPQNHTEQKTSWWQSIFVPRIPMISGFAVAIILCGFFIIGNMQPASISIGIYDGFPTRGVQPPFLETLPVEAKILHFKEIKDYDVWSQSVLESHEKLRIAVTAGEITIIQIWRRKGDEVVKTTYAMPGDDLAAVQKKIDELCRSSSLNSD
jgi:hypothetical protein